MHAVSPSRAGASGQHKAAPWCLPATGKVTRLPGGELKAAGDQDDHTDSDRHGMQERPSTAGTSFSLRRIASRRSIRRPAACSPRSRPPAASVTRDSRGPKGRSGWGSIGTGRSIKSIPRTGAILRTIESNRFVTGVTWVDGELWHGTWEGDESNLRRVDPRTGEVLERLEMPPGVDVTGLESDGGDQFFCGGGRSGKVRTVRRPKRGSAPGRGSKVPVVSTSK